VTKLAVHRSDFAESFAEWAEGRAAPVSECPGQPEALKAVYEARQLLVHIFGRERASALWGTFMASPRPIELTPKQERERLIADYVRRFGIELSDDKIAKRLLADHPSFSPKGLETAVRRMRDQMLAAGALMPGKDDGHSGYLRKYHAPRGA
jgi:hypothetical protein